MPAGNSSASRVRKRKEKVKDDNKKFACKHDGCERSFTRAEHLQRHSLNHSTGEHTCERCRAHFKRRDLLERHLLRHRQKDSEAGVPGCGVLNTRKRMWKDADGNIVAKKPALNNKQSLLLSTQSENLRLESASAYRIDQADENLPISPPISHDNSLRQSHLEDLNPEIPDSYPSIFGNLELPSIASISPVEQQFWCPSLPEPEQSPNTGTPDEIIFDEIFNPDTASSFNNPFTTMNNYNWLFDLDISRQLTLQPLADEQSRTFQFGHAINQGGQLMNIEIDSQRIEAVPSADPLHQPVAFQAIDSATQLTPSDQPATPSLPIEIPALSIEPPSHRSVPLPVGVPAKMSDSGNHRAPENIERPMSMLQSSSCLPIIDELTRAQLLDLIDIMQPVAPDGSFVLRDHPLLSLSCLQMYCDLYFTRFNTVYPLVHMSTFEPSTLDILLLASVLLLGATYGDKDAHQLAVCIHDVLRPQIFASSGFSTKPALWVLQTILLVECFGKSRAGQKQHDMSHLFHGLLINLIRRSDCQNIRSPHLEKPSNDLEEDWRRWVEAEQRKRLAFLSFMWDTQHAVLFCQSLCMSAFELRSSLPCKQSLWEADSAEKWHHLRQTEPTEPLFLSYLKTYLKPSASGTIPHDLGALSRTLLLHGLMSLAWDMQRRDQTSLGFIDTNPLSNWQARLATSYDTWNRDFEAFSHSYRSELPSPSHALATEFDAFRGAICALYHAAQILLHTPFLDLQIYAGSRHILGRPVTRSDYVRSQTIVKKWVTSSTSAAGNAMWHAAAIVDQGIVALDTTCGDSLGARLWHLPWTVYLGTLVIWGAWHACPMTSMPLNSLHGEDEDEIIWDPESVMKGFLEKISASDPEQLLGRGRSSAMTNGEVKRGTNGLTAVVSGILGKVRWAVMHDGMIVLRGLVCWRSVRGAEST